MSKGKKSKREKSTSSSSERGANSVKKAAQETPSREQKCSFCDTWLDDSKTPEKKCWLCGVNQFVDPTEIELEERKKQLERRELCCPNSACSRPVELVPNAEKYCSGCGTVLEKASLDLWVRKSVEPALGSGSGSLPSRSVLIDAARRLGLSLENSEPRLASEIQRFHQAAPQPPSQVKTRLAELNAAGVVPPTTADIASNKKNLSTHQDEAGSYTAEDTIARQRQTESYLTIERLRRRLRVKYSVVIGCVLMVLLFLLAVGLLGRSNRSPKPNGNDPQPTQATSTPAPMPSQQQTPPGMVLIAGGTFTMGRDRKNRGDEYESPAHEVAVKSFYIDTHEVTREEYRTCVVAGACPPPYGWTGHSYPANTGRWPVTGVGWANASMYAISIGKRLPTEEEWEFAARGRDGMRYPWGDDFRLRQANINTLSLEEVGRYEPHHGLFDLLGNAQEWTSSEWRQYPDKSAYVRTSERAERLRVIRGGSYRSPAGEATFTYRNALRMQEDAAEEDHYEQTGFRCVQDYPAP